jgi:hypothetical protein
MNASAKYQPRLKTKYQTEIIKNLQEKNQFQQHLKKIFQTLS